MEKEGDVWQVPVSELWNTKNANLVPVVTRGEKVDITWKGHVVASIVPNPEMTEAVRDKWWAGHNVGLRRTGS